MHTHSFPKHLCISSFATLFLSLSLSACQPSGNPSLTGIEQATQMPTAQNWELSTLAGRAAGAEFPFGFQDGAGPNSLFYNPSSIALDADGDLLVLDRYNYVIRKIQTESGQVSTLWGSPGERGNRDGNSESGRLNQALGMVLAPDGTLYIADAQNHSIRRLSTTGELSTVAGTGAEGYVDANSEEAKFNWPGDLALDEMGNLYVADRFNHAIRKITPAGQVSTLAGQGEADYIDAQGKEAAFFEPMGIVYHEGHLYVSDSQNHSIRKLSLDGTVSTFAGSGQPGSRDDEAQYAEFRAPAGLDFDSQGNLYVADRMNHRIRKITPEAQVSSLSGQGKPDFADGPSGLLSYPFDLVVAHDALIYVADYSNHAIRKITPVTPN